MSKSFVEKLVDEQYRVAEAIKDLDAQADSGHPDSLAAVNRQRYLGGYQDGLDRAMMLYKISTGWLMD